MAGRAIPRTFPVMMIVPGNCGSNAFLQEFSGIFQFQAQVNFITHLFLLLRVL